jgi:hypothetical protein
LPGHPGRLHFYTRLRILLLHYANKASRYCRARPSFFTFRDQGGRFITFFVRLDPVSAHFVTKATVSPPLLPGSLIFLYISSARLLFHYFLRPA